MSWPLEPLGSICEIVSGITKDSKKQGDEYREVPYLRVANVQRLRLDLSEMKTIPAKETTIASYRLEAGDILLNEGGDRDKLGRGWIWQGQISECIHQNHVFRARIRAGKAIPKWIAYYANTNEARAYFLTSGKQTTNLASISKKNLSALPVPLPTTDVQESVVAEIDIQLSRLDETVTILQGIQAKLKQARASILKAAVEGRLVETEAELGRAGASQLKSASELLAEICPTHPRNGTEKRQVKLKIEHAGLGELQEVDGVSLPNTPEGWAWTFIGSIATTVRNGYSGKPSDHGPVKILRISAVRAMSVNIADTRSLPGHISDYANAVAREGCLLITRYNGNPHLVGVMGHYRSKDLVVHPDKLIRVELASEKIRPEWIEIAFNTGLTRSLLRKRVRTTAGQAGISGQDIKAMPIPLPPTEEQIRIVREVNRRFSVLDQVESTVQASLARCTLQRQAILKRAFEGRLVPPPPEPHGR
ncbi:MAG: restriction endonuclease subunit S [Cyanobacteriota bacterium]